MFGDEDNLLLDTRDAIEAGMRVQAIRRPLVPGEAHGLAMKVLAYLRQRRWTFKREPPGHGVGGAFFSSARPPEA